MRDDRAQRRIRRLRAWALFGLGLTAVAQATSLSAALLGLLARPALAQRDTRRA